MSDALAPLRHAYGVEPSGPPPTPGGPGHAEWEILRTTRAALDAWDAPAPPAAAVAAVVARASEAVPREAPVADPALAPLAVALGLPSETGGDGAEAVLLADTLAALDAVPRRRPSREAVQAVRAAATEATAALAAVRAVYEEGPETDTVEAAVLRQSRRAVERALAARPRPRPPAAVVDAVTARAAEAAPAEAAVSDPALAPLATAAGLPLADGLDAGGAAETVLLAQTLDAIGRLPRPRPPAHVLDAALAAAVQPARRRSGRAADRAPSRPDRRRAPVGVWAGAGLVLVALVAVFTLPSALGPEGEVQSDALVAEAPVASEPAVAAPGDEPAAEPAAPAVPDAGPPLVAAAEPPAPAPAAPAPLERTLVAERTPDPVPARAAAVVPDPEPPSWEVDDDLRALSLRLQELDRETEGVVLGGASEAFGMPAVGPTSALAPGVQAVREGAPPARVRYRPDSSRVQR